LPSWRGKDNHPAFLLPQPHALLRTADSIHSARIHDTKQDISQVLFCLVPRSDPATLDCARGSFVHRLLGDRDRRGASSRPNGELAQLDPSSRIRAIKAAAGFTIGKDTSRVRSRSSQAQLWCSCIVGSAPAQASSSEPASEAPTRTHTHHLTTQAEAAELWSPAPRPTIVVNDPGSLQRACRRDLSRALLLCPILITKLFVHCVTRMAPAVGKDVSA